MVVTGVTLGVRVAVLVIGITVMGITMMVIDIYFAQIDMVVTRLPSRKIWINPGPIKRQ
jgi:hypothetical protein